MSELIPVSGIPTAIATLVVSVGVAAVYLYVGKQLIQRPVSDRSRLASYQFSLWWIGLAASVSLTAFGVALALLNALPFPLALTLYLVSVIVDCVLLWGLVGALIYVYTGKYHLLGLGTYYAAFFVTVIYWVLLQDPNAVILPAGVPTIAYATSPPVALSLVVILGLLGPEIAGAIFYLSLLRQTSDRTIRYRIALVGSSILLWFALDVFFPAGTASWVLARGAVEVIPGLMSLIALLPPEWVRRRLGVAGTEGPEEYYRESPADP